MKNVVSFALLLVLGCATATSTSAPAGAEAVEQIRLCKHHVPADDCTQCHPELAANFKKIGDWCEMHGLPESHCLKCHPDLTFEPLPKLPEDADLKVLSGMGEDVATLEPVAGKVTIFDFFATWCAPCKKIDRHVFTLMQQRGDIALRKLNVMNWESAVAKRYLSQVPTLPYLVVFGKDGKPVGNVRGFDLRALDKAIAQASAR